MAEAKEKFDEIWSFIEQKLKIPVPPYIKYILKYCGYNNGITIAAIENDDIQHFVDEVKNGNVSDYYKPNIEEKELFEGSTKNKENFEFSRGHLVFLKSIVALLKKHIEENGSDSFILEKEITKKKSSIKKSGDNTSSAPKKRVKRSAAPKNLASILQLHKHRLSNEKEKQPAIEQQKNILIRKMLTSLSSNTQTLFAKNEKMINEKLSELIVVVEKHKKPASLSEDQSVEDTVESCKETLVEYTADMYCPYCWIPITVFHVTKGAPRWNSGNFDRHLRLIHPEDPDVKADDIETQAIESQDAEAHDKKSQDETLEKQSESIDIINIEGQDNETPNNKIQNDTVPDEVARSDDILITETNGIVSEKSIKQNETLALPYSKYGSESESLAESCTDEPQMPMKSRALTELCINNMSHISKVNDEYNKFSNMSINLEAEPKSDISISSLSRGRKFVYRETSQSKEWKAIREERWKKYF